MRRTGIVTAVVINNQNQIGNTIILKRSSEVDEGPYIGGKSDFTTEHLVGSRNGNPVGFAGEGFFGSSLQIEVQSTGLLSTFIIEGSRPYLPA